MFLPRVGCTRAHSLPSPVPPQTQPDQTPMSTLVQRLACPLKTHTYSPLVSLAPRRPGSNLWDLQAHTHLDLVFTTLVTPRAADAFTKSLLVTTPSNSESHTTVAVWKPSTTAPCTIMRRRLGQGNNTTASPLRSQVLPSRFSPPPFSPSSFPARNVWQLLRGHCRPIWCVGYGLTVACNAWLTRMSSPLLLFPPPPPPYLRAGLTCLEPLAACGRVVPSNLDIPHTSVSLSIFVSSSVIRFRPSHNQLAPHEHNKGKKF